jgi:rhomboid family GlyGly-CTERM serine protease
MRVPWISAALAATGLAVACVPGSAEALQYDRVRVMAGEAWLLLSSQMAHWTARMTLMDLGVLVGLGAWLEARGERRNLVFALVLGAAGTALAVHMLSPDLLYYRGSSGLASALFVLTALHIARSSGGAARALALLACALFLAKAAWESLSGQALFAGPLAPGVRVVPLVHLLGGVGGAVAKLAETQTVGHKR